MGIVRALHTPELARVQKQRMGSRRFSQDSESIVIQESATSTFLPTRQSKIATSRGNVSFHRSHYKRPESKRSRRLPAKTFTSNINRDVGTIASRNSPVVTRERYLH